MNPIVTTLHQLLDGFHHLGLASLLTAFGILIMDAALSGDNSIAINAVALHLQPAIQNKAVWLGMVFAAVLRIVALGFAAYIMVHPWVQVLGAAYLIYLCVGHFMSKGEDDDGGASKPRKSLLAVLIIIGFLDLSLSLDNIVAVVAMSQNLAVIYIGVLASIALLAVATQVTRRIMGRYPSLESAAYVILGFLGLLMLAEHGPAFLLWVEQSLIHLQGPISAVHIDLGDAGEIIGVATIVAYAVIKDEMAARKALLTPAAAPAPASGAAVSATTP